MLASIETILSWLRPKRKFISSHNKNPGGVLTSGTAGSSTQTNAFGISCPLGATFFCVGFILRKALLYDGEIGHHCSRLTSYQPAFPMEGEFSLS